MTDVVSAEAVASPPTLTRQVLNQLVIPLRDDRDALRASKEAMLFGCVPTASLKPLRRFRLSREEAEQQLTAEQARARAWMAKAPERQTVLAWRASFLDALTGYASRTQVEMLIAILIDGYPNARPANPDGYLDAVSATIEGRFTSSVIATAIVHLWRANRFAPSPAEVFSACSRIRSEIEADLACAERCLRNHETVDLLLSKHVDSLIPAVMSPAPSHGAEDLDYVW